MVLLSLLALPQCLPIAPPHFLYCNPSHPLKQRQSEAIDVSHREGSTSPRLILRLRIRSNTTFDHLGTNGIQIIHIDQRREVGVIIAVRFGFSGSLNEARSLEVLLSLQVATALSTQPFALASTTSSDQGNPMPVERTLLQCESSNDGIWIAELRRSCMFFSIDSG